MKSTDLFPDEEERKAIKEIMDFFGGEITRVVANGEVVYERNSFESIKSLRRDRRE